MQTENENYERHHLLRDIVFIHHSNLLLSKEKIVVLIAVKLKTDHADNLTAGHKKFCY